MKYAPIKKEAVWFAFGMICLSVFGQEGKFQAPAWESRVNQRQPPELVLKTIGIKPGLIIGEVGREPDATRSRSPRESDLWDVFTRTI